MAAAKWRVVGIGCLGTTEWGELVRKEDDKEEGE